MADPIAPRAQGPEVGLGPTDGPDGVTGGWPSPGGPRPPESRGRRWWPKLAALAVLVIGSGAAAYWYLNRVPGLPLGIVVSNGRLEAQEIDIDTKFAGRISQILADEGDLVKQGQVVAVIDTQDLQTQLAAAQWQTAEAQESILRDQANLVEMASSLRLTAQELKMAGTLVKQGFETVEVLDQRQSQFNTAVAAYHNTEAMIRSAKAGVESATHSADLFKVNIADDTLVAPRDGPIEYRLRNLGEVLPAGGQVFTMLDATYVYMDIFLPDQSAGRVKFGDQASILLDALPKQPLPANVTFIAARNEFTPKAVETTSERDKLMFRIRLRIDPNLLRKHETEVRSGLPGLGYIRLDSTAWPVAIRPIDAR